MPRTLFISDLHLDAARPAVTRALADFLSRQNDCERLYILGDLFEAWIGDDDDAPLATRVAQMLRDGAHCLPLHYPHAILLLDDFVITPILDDLFFEFG